jgi:hypothetical protein
MLSSLVQYLVTTRSKHFRGIFSRFYKADQIFLGFLNFVGAFIWLRYFGSQSLADLNSVTFRFERKGMIIYDTEGICQDTFMMHAIEEGVQDVEIEESNCIIFCELEDLHKIAAQ